MSLQAILSAPTLICPDPDAVYRLDGRSYRLMNATGSWLSVHFVNLGASPATVAGSIAGAAGALIVEPGAAFMLGWSPRDTTWRALRLVGVQTPGPEGIPADAQIYALRVPGPDGVLSAAQSRLAPAPADAALLVEALDGPTARATLLVSLVDATVATNSYAFTGRPANSSVRSIVIPQNANGSGTPSGQFLSYTTA